MDPEKYFLEIFRAMGVIRAGHFEYDSGLHGDTFVDRAAIYMHPEIINNLCRILAQRFANDSIDVVVGSTALAMFTGLHLTSTGRTVLSVLMHKRQGHHGYYFRDGLVKLLPNKRVLLVKDVLAGGGSVHRAAQLVRGGGGILVGLAAMWNRGGLAAMDLDVPRLESIEKMPLPSYEPHSCPLCLEGVPLDHERGRASSWPPPEA